MTVKSIGAKAVTFTKPDGKTTRFDVDTPRMEQLVRDVAGLLEASHHSSNGRDWVSVLSRDPTFGRTGGVINLQDRGTEATASVDAMNLAARHARLDRAIDQLSDTEVHALYRKMGLAGELLNVDKKREALKQEHPDDTEAAMKAKPEAAKPEVSDNTVFTEDAAEKAREVLRQALRGTQLNTGLDPKVLQAALTLSGYHVERGARTFAAYSQAMIKDLGDEVRPYLKSFYMALKYDPKAAGIAEGMSSEAEVNAEPSTEDSRQSDEAVADDRRRGPRRVDDGPGGNRTKTSRAASEVQARSEEAQGAPEGQASGEVDPEQEAANRQEDIRQQRSQRMKAMLAERAKLKPTDELLTAVAKLGGLSKADAEAQGIDPAHFSEQRAGIKFVFRPSGKSFDAMAEALDAEGYPVQDGQGRYSANTLLDLVTRSLSGSPVYTTAGYDAMMAAEEVQRALEDGDTAALPPSEIAGYSPEESVVIVSFNDVINSGYDWTTVYRMIGDNDTEADMHRLFAGLIAGEQEYVERYHTEAANLAGAAGVPSQAEEAENENIPGFGEGQAADDLTDDELTRHLNGESLEAILASRQADDFSLEAYTEADIAEREARNADAQAEAEAAQAHQIEASADSFTLGTTPGNTGASNRPRTFTYKIKPAEGGFIITSDDGGGIVMSGRPNGPGILNTTPVRVFATEADARAYMERTGMKEAGQDLAASPAAEPSEADDKDHFSVKRLNDNRTEFFTTTFKRDEYVKALISSKDSREGERFVTGRINGISHARQEAKVNEVWFGFGSIYKTEQPSDVKPDTVPLSSVIDSLNARHGAGLTDADRVPDYSSILSAEADLWSRITDGTATVDEFKAGFERWVTGKEEIKAVLSKQTKKELLEMAGGMLAYRLKNEAKPAIVEAVWRDGMAAYALGSSITYGMGRDSYTNAVRRLVEGTDADALKQFADERKAAAEEAIAERAAAVEAIKEPKTLDDFIMWMRSRMSSTGESFTEARMGLTPDQRATFDKLSAESTREAREARKRALKTTVRTAGKSVGGEIIATKHTRDNYDLFVVQLAERLSADDYRTVLDSAKKLGGWYSAYRGNGATPGFQFKERASAEAFLKLAAGDSGDAQAQAEQRRDEFEDDRSQTAVERLTEMADRLDQRADESLIAERKQNTARRARFAASAEAAANADKALAKTMRNIASAISEGKAELLDAVRQKTQVEMLAGMVRTAKDKEIRTKFPAYADQEKQRGSKPTSETADFAEFPSFTSYRSDLASLARQLLEVDGTKKIGQRLLKVADDVSDAYLEFAKANLSKVATFSIAGGTAALPSKDAAEKAISRSGLAGKAIVLPVKRGENLIILSPSEAINRGIWTGDGDKRITLTRNFGNELIQTIGRRANKSNRLTVPWQLETAADRLKALAGMGIETPAELRAALREFIALQEQPSAPNKIKEMERAMIGRRNDGLDFFPTPYEVADQMIEAAGIEPGMAVLEPSAGMGHIAERIQAAGVDPDVVELSGDRRELLEAKGFRLVGADFLSIKPREFFTFGDTFRAQDGTEGVMRGLGGMGSNRVRLEEESGRVTFHDRDELTGIKKNGSDSGYDRIIMNPPFGDRRDAEHVRHAYSLLKPGGRLVAIMGEGVFFGSDKKAQEFRDWLEQVGGTDEKLAENTFMDPSLPVNTGVSARMVVIDKPASGDNLYSRSEQWYFSPLTRAVEGMKQETALASQWRAMIEKAPGVKSDELEATGVIEWLQAAGGKVKKSDILDFLAGLPLFAKGENNGKLTKSALDKQLRSGLLGSFVGRMIDNGSIILHASSPARHADGAEGWTESDGTIHLVANALRPATVLPTLLHELFHRGNKAISGTKAHQKLMKGLESLYKQYKNAPEGSATNEFYKKAVRRVEGAKTKEAQQVEEFGAYAITAFESAPRSVRKWVQEFIGNVKAWMLRRLGVQAGDITPAQLRAMAVYALKSDGRRKIVPDGVAMASEKAYSLDNAQTALLPAGQGVAYRNGQESLKSRIFQWADHFNLNGRGGIGLVAREWEEPSRYKAEPGRKNAFLSADDVVATPEEGRAEQQRLVAAAKENGFLFDLDSPLFKALSVHEKRGGMEHDAYIVGDEQERFVIRNTINGNFGHANKHSPAYYLKRLADYNRVFPNLQTRMIGVVQEPDGTISILTAQVFAPGKEYPNNKELDAAMRKHGWFAMGVPSDKLPARYKHKDTGAILADVHHGNILHDGDNLYPIDVIVEKLPSATDGTMYSMADNQDQSEAEPGQSIASRIASLMPGSNHQQDSEFHEETRRLREKDKTAWSKARNWWKRNFYAGGLLPDGVYDEKIKRDGAFNAIEHDVTHLTGMLTVMVKKEYGKDLNKLSDTDKELMADALAGKWPGDAVKLETRATLLAMRKYIDSLSGEYTKYLADKVAMRLAIDPDLDLENDADARLLETITGNIGRYVHRSYRAFDDKNWYKEVPESVIDDAMRYLMDRHIENGETEVEARRRAEVAINEIIKTGTAYDSMDAFIAEGKLGAKDLSILIKRKEIAPEIRALLGEYKDPRLNFAKSATKMARLVWNQRLLDRVRDIGLGTFLFTDDTKPANATVQIAGESSEVYAPLNGLWTTPEIAQAFKDILGKDQLSDLMRHVVAFNAAVKYGKTVLSPTTAMRNIQSALFFTVANGHFDYSKASKAIEAFKEQVLGKTGDAYMRRMLELGVTYDTPNMDELKQWVKESGYFMANEDAIAPRKWLSKLNERVQGFYRFGDDFWKIIGFENEKAVMLKAGLPLAEAEARAAQRIRNTYPTYSMIGRGTKWLSRFPLVGTFVSFPAEIIRTSGHIFKYMAQDIRSDNKQIRAMGARKLVGAALVSGGFYALSALTKAAFDMDDDDEEVIRVMAPEWSKNSTFLFWGRNEKTGQMEYTDLSFLDPYGYWKRPITAMMRDQPWDEALASGMRDMLAPFFSWDITTNTILEVIRNKKASGSSVYDETASRMAITGQVSEHIAKSLSPGFIGNIQRIYSASKDEKKATGQPYVMKDEMMALVGWRHSTTDPRAAIRYRAMDYLEQNRIASGALNRVLREQNTVPDERIVKAVERSVEAKQRIYKDMSMVIKAAMKSGMDDIDVEDILRAGSISKDAAISLVEGEMPEVTLSMTSLKKAVQAAEAAGDYDRADELYRRYDVAQDALDALGAKLEEEQESRSDQE